ncbi:hypothetical protein ZWY2020_058724 [Hordeum vulgare]|nr:hypothetical protein ZWY2020_058724 [Hordeum vulgare]
MHRGASSLGPLWLLCPTSSAYKSPNDQKDRPWFYFISSTSLVISITALLFQWREEPIISFSGNFQTNNFNEIFQFLILLCSTLCIPLSI